MRLVCESRVGTPSDSLTFTQLKQNVGGPNEIEIAARALAIQPVGSLCGVIRRQSPPTCLVIIHVFAEG